MTVRARVRGRGGETRLYDSIVEAWMEGVLVRASRVRCEGMYCEGAVVSDHCRGVAVRAFLERVGSRRACDTG